MDKAKRLELIKRIARKGADLPAPIAPKLYDLAEEQHSLGRIERVNTVEDWDNASFDGIISPEMARIR